MRRVLGGAVGALLLASAGLWIWQGQAVQNEIPASPPPPAMAEGLPEAGNAAAAFGTAPPTPPEAPKASRKEQRFNRYDRNRDEIISRLEMMGSRTKAFKSLDKDNNNLLSFEEWAAVTSDRFAKADGNRDALLTRREFAETRPKAAPKTLCRC